MLHGYHNGLGQIIQILSEPSATRTSQVWKRYNPGFKSQCKVFFLMGKEWANAKLFPMGKVGWGFGANTSATQAWSAHIFFLYHDTILYGLYYFIKLYCLLWHTNCWYNYSNPGVPYGNLRITLRSVRFHQYLIILLMLCNNSFYLDANSKCSGKTAQMCCLAWALAVFHMKLTLKHKLLKTARDLAKHASVQALSNTPLLLWALFT